MAQLQEKYQSAYTGADLDAAIARSKNITATDTELNYSSGVTSAIQTQIDGKSTVSVAAAGTATEEVQYITIDGVEKKLAGGGGAEYTAGTGIKIEDNVISNTLKVDYGEIEEATPLCFTALTAGSRVRLTKSGSPAWTGSYSTDGTTWQTYTPGTTGYITLTNVGDKIYFKGVQTAAFSGSNYLKFGMSGSIAASGSCMSLWCGDNFATATAIPYNYAGAYLFQECSALKTVSADFLPAITLTNYCYRYMFSSCTGLTTPPALPATTLATACYQAMFSGCTALTSVPALPATALVSSCYTQLCYGCTSLIVSDASGTGYDKAWKFPNEGTFTHSGYASQEYVFTNCAVGSGRASDYLVGQGGQSYTYYTQNDPIVFPTSNKSNESNTKNVKLLDEEGNEINVVSKQDKLTAGDNITIDGTTISATDTKYTAGSKISISGTTISTTANQVSVSATGTATEEIQYITIDGTEKKIAGGSGGGRVDYEEVINYPEKGDKISIDGNAYLVLKNTEGTKYQLFGQFIAGSATFSSSISNTYLGSNADTALNTTFYNTLSTELKAAIQEVTINQNQYTANSSGATATHYSYADYSTKAVKASGARKVYLPDIEDVEEFFSNTFGSDDIISFFGDGTYPKVSFRSALANSSQYIWGIYGEAWGQWIYYEVDGRSTYNLHPTMVVDLSQVSFSYINNEPSNTKDVKLLDENGNEINVVAKQDVLTASTDITVKTMTGGITYVTEAPTAANTDGLKIAVLTAEPATKYDGWLYIIVEPGAETWLITRSNPAYGGGIVSFTESVTFTSNEQSFDQIQVDTGGENLYYIANGTKTTAYSMGWRSDAWKTIVITGTYSDVVANWLSIVAEKQ